MSARGFGTPIVFADGEGSVAVSVPGPILGPCSLWISGDDVAACCPTKVGSAGPEQYDTVAVEASMLMFELSGRQFSGLCRRTVRPCRQACACFGQSPSMGMGPWYWTSAWYSGGGAYWRNECGDKCGCGTESYVRLAGYPVREVEQVKIDGVVVPSSTYKLVRRRRLMRMDDPGPPAATRSWPACQDLALEDTQPGTFSVTYSYGADPPPLGRDAAAELACQLYQACHGGDCQLPNKVTTVVRQGVTMQRIVPLASLLRSGATGLPVVDAFIAAYNPTGLRRRPAVFSPDLNQFAREV